MKKLALFAMLLGSTFIYGCGNPTPEKPKEPAPAAGDTTKPADEAAKPADEAAKPADEAAKPAEPAK